MDKKRNYHKIAFVGLMTLAISLILIHFFVGYHTVFGFAESPLPIAMLWLSYVLFAFGNIIVLYKSMRRIQHIILRALVATVFAFLLATTQVIASWLFIYFAMIFISLLTHPYD